MSNSDQITHVLFDMDGTVVDSESLLYEAIDKVCKKYSKIVSFDVKQKLLGHPFKERTKQLYIDLQFDDSVLSFGQFITQLIADCIRNVTENGMQLMPGIENVVKYFKRNNIPMAIASGNTRHSYDETVERFGNFFDHFSHAVLSGDESDQIRGKPHPDIYLKAYERFSPKPKSVSNVLVFEDSEVGVRSAISAGMRCVYVVDQRLNTNKDLNIATIVIKSLNDFKPELFGLPKNLIH